MYLKKREGVGSIGQLILLVLVLALSAYAIRVIYKSVRNTGNAVTNLTGNFK